MKNTPHEAVLFLALTFAAALAFAACVVAVVLVARLPTPGIPLITPGVAHSARASVEAKR